MEDGVGRRGTFFVHLGQLSRCRLAAMPAIQARLLADRSSAASDCSARRRAQPEQDFGAPVGINVAMVMLDTAGFGVLKVDRAAHRDRRGRESLHLIFQRRDAAISSSTRSGRNSCPSCQPRISNVPGRALLFEPPALHAAN
jgi:hypothetical protein